MSACSLEDSVNALQAFYRGLKEEGCYIDGESARLECRWARYCLRWSADSSSNMWLDVRDHVAANAALPLQFVGG